MFKHFAFALLASVILAGCVATTKLSGYTDPNYRDGYESGDIMVLAPDFPLEEQKAIEQAFAEALGKHNIVVYSGLDAFPPTRKSANINYIKEAKKAGAESLLILSDVARDVSETYVPPTYHPGQTTSYVSGFGNYATVSTYTSPGYTTGGYTVSRPGMAVEVQLINLKNSETVWHSEGTSMGDGSASFVDLGISTARTSVTELDKAGLLNGFQEETVAPQM